MLNGWYNKKQREKVSRMKNSLAGSKVPAYVAVYNSLYSDIRNGVYPPNESLPGELALAEKYGVSRNTLRQALAILSEDGLITRSQGKETIVAAVREGTPGKHGDPMLRLCRQEVDGVAIQFNYGPPTDIARSKLELGAGDIILAADLVYRVGETVVGYAFTQVPVAYFNDVGVDAVREDAVEQLTTRQIFEYSDQWDVTVKLIYANEMESPTLTVPVGTPLILMETLLRKQNQPRPFARCKFYFRPEYYHLRLLV